MSVFNVFSSYYDQFVGKFIDFFFISPLESVILYSLIALGYQGVPISGRGGRGGGAGEFSYPLYFTSLYSTFCNSSPVICVSNNQLVVQT